jgi:hypothetical protein
VVEADAIRTSAQVEAPARLDACHTNREHEQRVAPGVGHVAPGGRRAMVHARDVRRPNARGRAAQAPSARVAQLEHALAAEEHDGAPTTERGDLTRGAGSRRQPVDGRRAAARERGHRRQERRT